MGRLLGGELFLQRGVGEPFAVEAHFGLVGIDAQLANGTRRPLPGASSSTSRPAHSRRVGALARQLFDGLARFDLVPINPGQDLRSALYGAALMHDVGRFKHNKGHHKASYRLIRRLAPPLGWTASQLQVAAAAASRDRHVRWQPGGAREIRATPSPPPAH